MNILRSGRLWNAEQDKCSLEPPLYSVCASLCLWLSLSTVHPLSSDPRTWPLLHRIGTLHSSSWEFRGSPQEVFPIILP